MKKKNTKTRKAGKRKPRTKKSTGFNPCPEIPIPIREKIRVQITDDTTLTVVDKDGREVTLNKTEILGIADKKKFYNENAPLMLTELKPFPDEGIMIAPGQILAIYSADGSLRRITAEQVADGLEVYANRFPPAVASKVEFNEQYRKGAYNEIFFNRSLFKPDFTATSAAIEEFRNKVKEAEKCIEQQSTEGNWDYDRYNHGYYNGMELILSIFENRPPKFRDRPDKFKDDRDNSVTMKMDQREMEVEEIIDHMMKLVAGREKIFPGIINLMNDRLFGKLRQDAELTHEWASVAKTRFDEALKIIDAFRSK